MCWAAANRARWLLRDEASLRFSGRERLRPREAAGRRRRARSRASWLSRNEIGYFAVDVSGHRAISEVRVRGDGAVLRHARNRNGFHAAVSRFFAICLRLRPEPRGGKSNGSGALPQAATISPNMFPVAAIYFVCRATGRQRR